VHSNSLKWGTSCCKLQVLLKGLWWCSMAVNGVGQWHGDLQERRVVAVLNFYYCGSGASCIKQHAC